MKQFRWIIFVSILFQVSCGSQEATSPFSFISSGEGVELLENGKPVYFYQQSEKSLADKYICNNYLHPLYNLNGDTLTEESPIDHPYHRGIYWTWHQIYINDKSVGDGWIMQNIETEVIDVKTKTNKKNGQLYINVLWKSPLFEDRKPFLSEHTTITVQSLQNNVRKIDFAISLKALVPGVEIGGSNDEKGYGGLCARLKLPDDLVFTSSKGIIIPQTYQIEAGPWMDFSASFGEDGQTTGIAILCHPETQNYPAPWILRSKTSMQNIVFPGRKRFKLSMDEPLVLHYRLIIHNGNAYNIDLNHFQFEYEGTKLEN